MKVYVDSEVGYLRAVLVGPVENFRLHQPINETQRHYYRSDPPQLDVLIKQHKRFIEVLDHYGVAIYWVDTRSDSPNQLNVRDVATVISNNLIICSMKEQLRQHEPLALENLRAGVEGQVFRVDAGVVEGGDIILDGHTLYVGLSERTYVTGLKWLEQNFGDRFEVVAVHLEPPFLHLDVVFNLIGDHLALTYTPALHASSLDTLRKRYKLIEVTRDEQFNLATNVLSLSPETVISNSQHARVNNLIKERGLEVIELEYSEIVKIGGAFRCGTCPLSRDPLSK